MGLDIRKKCLVCAWRETCAKKHTVRENALHCADFCRDLTIPEEPEGAPGRERHKQIDDVFGGR